MTRARSRRRWSSRSRGPPSPRGDPAHRRPGHRLLLDGLDVANRLRVEVRNTGPLGADRSRPGHGLPAGLGFAAGGRIGAGEGIIGEKSAEPSGCPTVLEPPAAPGGAPPRRIAAPSGRAVQAVTVSTARIRTADAVHAPAARCERWLLVSPSIPIDLLSSDASRRRCCLSQGEASCPPRRSIGNARSWLGRFTVSPIPIFRRSVGATSFNLV